MTQGSTLATDASVRFRGQPSAWAKGLADRVFCDSRLDWARLVCDAHPPPGESQGNKRAAGGATATHNYPCAGAGSSLCQAAGHYVFTVDGCGQFSLFADRELPFVLDGKVLMEGNMREGNDLSAMGNFKSASGFSPPNRRSRNLPRRIRSHSTSRTPIPTTSSWNTRTAATSPAAGSRSSGKLPRRRNWTKPWPRPKGRCGGGVCPDFHRSLRARRCGSRSMGSAAATGPASTCRGRSRSCWKR